MGKSNHLSRQPQLYDAKIDETASKDWKILLGKATDAPPEPSLFDRVGLEIKKNRLDHRENDSRAVSSCVCQLLSDSNNKIYEFRCICSFCHLELERNKPFGARRQQVMS